MIRVACLFLGAVMIAVAARYPAPGEAKAGRVVIDDSHSFEWAQAARRLDTEYFGDFSTYSYTTMAEHLSRCYGVEVVTREGSLIDALGQCDVLILKTPQIDFTSREVDAIREWVRAGGGLMALGDHTDLFGMNTRLNRVIAPMGASLLPDSVRHASNPYFVQAEVPSLGRHPSLARIESFQFMTGCSVSTTHASSVAMVATDALTEPADYINSSRFPSWSSDGRYHAGRVPVQAAFEYGSGRVIVCTDSTVFSSFDYYKGDYVSTMSSHVAWLNRRNSLGLQPLLAGIGALLILLVGAVVGARSVLGAVGLAALTGGAYAGLWLVAPLGEQYYPRVHELEAPPEVAFVTGGSYVLFPPSLGDPGVDPEALHDTMFNAPLRLGRRAHVAADIDAAMATQGVRTIVLVNLWDAPTQSSLVRLREWVDGGGALLVFQRAAAYRTPGSSALAGAFDLGLELRPDGAPWVRGARRLKSPAGVAAGERAVGKGSVVFVVSDDAFCNNGLGHSMGIPTREQRARYDFLFELFSYEGSRQDLVFVRR